MSEVIIVLEWISKDVNVQMKQCIKCRQQNLHPQHYAQLHLEVPLMPMLFIMMDLIGRFKLLPEGHQCALTVIDMLTNYTQCIVLFTKETDKWCIFT